MFEQVINNLIASVPQFIVLLTALMSGKKNVQSVVNSFPQKLIDVKNGLETGYLDFKKQAEKIITERVDMLAEKTTGVLTNMESKISHYAGQIDTLISTNVQLVKENKTYQNILGIMVSCDADMIKKEISTLVSNELNLSIEELKRLPSEVISALPQFKNELKATLDAVGHDFLRKILVEIGYEKTEETKQ